MMAGASLIKSGLAQRGGIFSAWAKATMRRCLIPSLTVHDGAWRLPQSRCLASYAVPPNRRSGNQLKREAREKSKSNDASAVDGEGAVDTPANDSEGGGEAERIGRSRGRHDRADSLSAEILSDRAAHLERIRLAIAESDSVGGGDEVKAAIARLESLGFGHKKLKNQIYGEFSKSGAGRAYCCKYYTVALFPYCYLHYVCSLFTVGCLGMQADTRCTWARRGPASRCSGTCCPKSSSRDTPTAERWTNHHLLLYSYMRMILSINGDCFLYLCVSPPS